MEIADFYAGLEIDDFQLPGDRENDRRSPVRQGRCGHPGAGLRRAAHQRRRCTAYAFHSPISAVVVGTLSFRNIPSAAS